MTDKEYTIDAAGKSLGRVAAEAAKLLTGKNLVTYVRNSAPAVSVKVVNASQLKISEKKRDTKQYAYFSGYQGGLRFVTLEALAEKKGYKAVLEHAIKGMLPKNKLRPGMLKRLHISE
jgi:large subunit ribosomal protein L13